MRRHAVPLLALLACLLAAAPAGAAKLLPPKGAVLQGVSGSTSPEPFRTEARASLGVFGVFVAWNSLGDYVFRSTDAAAGRLMLHVSTARGQHLPETITPLEIARGRGDAYLLRINRSIAAWGRPTYVRLLAEMNQADNAYAGFDHSGRSRGRSHAPRTFRQAWRRAALILRGGPLARIDARLRRLGLPPVAGAPGDLPRPRLAMVWVPQTRGTPDIRANMPAAYWPGRRYVDWVGTDFYSRYPNFHWLEQFYDRFGGKPFAFGEWALWGRDDPAFVRRLFRWVRTHRRVRMMLYNQGAQAGGPFRLSRYPRARGELRRQLRRHR